MKRLVAGTLLALGLGSLAHAATETEDVRETPPFEPVRSIWTYGGFHAFDVIDNDTLILWRTPFEPYLVELRFPSPDLRFARTVAIKSPTNRIYSKFDSVLVAGFRYPIGEIYKLSRDEARQLVRES